MICMYAAVTAARRQSTSRRAAKSPKSQDSQLGIPRHVCRLCMMNPGPCCAWLRAFVFSSSPPQNAGTSQLSQHGDTTGRAACRLQHRRTSYHSIGDVSDNATVQLTSHPCMRYVLYSVQVWQRWVGIRKYDTPTPALCLSRQSSISLGSG